jgi:molybdate transport system permease protein
MIIIAIDWFPVKLSLQVATLATVFGVLLGGSSGYCLSRYRFWGRDLLDTLLTLPLVLPPTVLGYYLLVALGRQSWLGKCWETVFGAPLVFTPTAAVVAATVHILPLIVKSARIAFDGIPTDVENAARLLGASRGRVFLTITLPLAARELWGATALAFARAWGDFGVTIMIAGNIPGRTQTAALAIYDAVQNGQTDKATSLVLIISLFCGAIVYLINKLAQPRF